MGFFFMLICFFAAGTWYLEIFSLIYFCFYCLSFWSYTQKITSKILSRSIFPMFSHGTSIVSSLTCRLWIYLKLLYVLSYMIFLYVICSFPKTYIEKPLLCSLCIVGTGTLVANYLTACVCFWILYPIPWVYVSIFIPVYTVFITVALNVI